MRGTSLLQYKGGIWNLLGTIYSKEISCADGYQRNGSKSQLLLYTILKERLDLDMEYNHVLDIIDPYPDSNRSMEVDIWIPRHNLCIEYQGIQHSDTSHFLGNIRDQIGKDECKKILCMESQLKLIHIYHHWNILDWNFMLFQLLSHCPELKNFLISPSN